MRQPERILRQRLVERIEHRSDGRVGRRPCDQLGVELLAPRGAVIAIAVGLVLGDVEQGAHALAANAQRDVGLALAIAARPDRQCCIGRCTAHRRIICKDLHHAAGSIAVQLGDRAAQHFDALGRSQAGGRRLALTVREGCGDAVDQDAHAAHAEGRACAETAHRHLQVLCKILPLPHLETRHATEKLRQVHERRRGAEGIDDDGID